MTNLPVLEVELPVDPVWAAGSLRACAMLRKWYGWRGPDPVYRVLQPLPPKGPKEGAQGLCFSGGVDSFFSLLRAEIPPEVLVFVHGYDLPWDAPGGKAYLENGIREIARQAEARVRTIRTNLREHPWKVVGAALRWPPGCHRASSRHRAG